MKNENSLKKKGIATIIVIAFLVMAVIVVTEGVILANYLVRSENIVRAIREEEIIKAINTVEFAKRGISQAVLYSFNQAAYDIGSRGGYFNIPSGISLNCVPYWKIFSASNIPSDFESELKQNVLKILNSYGDSLDIDVPKYEDVQFDKDNNLMNLTSSGKLAYDGDYYKISDSANFVQDVDMKVFKMFDVAKEVEEELNSGISDKQYYSDALNTILSIESSVGKKYSADGIEIFIQPSDNLGDSENHFAIRILVAIKDTSHKQLVYDYSGKSLQMNNLQFRYYMLVGNSQITPETNSCSEINYK